MKKLVWVFTVMILAIVANAQTDSAKKGVHFILKTNPTLMFTSGTVGEYGATLEVNFLTHFGASLGYGRNTTSPFDVPEFNAPGYSLSPSIGNTIRLGAYYFLGKKRHFLAFQMFFRNWQPTTTFNYTFQGGVSTFYPINKFAQNVSSDETASAAYIVQTTSSNFEVWDFLYGQQLVTHSFGGLRLFMEWFAGIGQRTSNINSTAYGLYNPQQWLPYNQPERSSSQTSALDIKLGIQIGIEF